MEFRALIIEEYEKFKTKTKDEVSSFNHNSSKNEIFCNPGAKIIYGDRGVISLHHHRRTSGDPIFRNMTGVYLTKLDPWNHKRTNQPLQICSHLKDNCNGRPDPNGRGHLSLNSL